MKVLVVKLSSLGDLFHALPAVHNLKIGLKAEIDWVVQEEYVELVKCFSDADRIIPFSRRHFAGNFRRFTSALREQYYDYAIDLQGLFKSGMVVGLSRARRKIGPSFHREFSRIFYKEIAGSPDNRRHAVARNMDVADYLHIDAVKPKFPVTFPIHPLYESRPRIAMLPVSRWHTKNWPPRYYANLVERLQMRISALTVYLLGSPDDVKVCEEIEKALLGRVINLAGQTSLVEMGSVLREMDLLIANDSGPVHMASAIGTPSLVMFGPTDPARTGPYGDHHRVIRITQDCQPCFSRKCRRAIVPCMCGITPDMVEKIALEMLGDRESSRDKS